MARFSNRTIRVLLDVFAADWTFARIQDLFEDAGVGCGPEAVAEQVSGVRRGIAQRYLSTLDLASASGTGVMIEVVNSVLLEGQHQPFVEMAHYEKFVKLLRRDGFDVDEENGQIVGPVQQVESWSLTPEAMDALPDADAIRDHLSRLTANVDSDPRLAVSAAKDLVESTAKLVLQKMDVAYRPREDLTALTVRAQESLGLSAAGVEGQTAESRAVKRLLGSVSGLAQGVTELRNQVGVGHGRESVPTWVRPRHARLAAGAANVWCQLMLETLDDVSAPWRRERR